MTSAPLSAFESGPAVPQGVRYEETSLNFAVPACPGMKIPFKVSYPQGLDGGGPVDGYLDSHGYLLEVTFGAFLKDQLSQAGDCDALQGAFMSFTGRPYRVSERMVSILFVEETKGIIGQSPLGYEAFNLTAGGIELTVAGLFPDPGSSLPIIWGRIYRGICAVEGVDSLPDLYGGLPCPAPGMPGVPPWLARADGTADALGHALITPLGLTVNLSPTELGTGEPLFIDIPREELETMGANPDIWR
jgi:hypothetical protein